MTISEKIVKTYCILELIVILFKVLGKFLIFKNYC